jgi:hypothetical protein
VVETNSDCGNRGSSRQRGRRDDRANDGELHRCARGTHRRGRRRWDRDREKGDPCGG